MTRVSTAYAVFQQVLRVPLHCYMTQIVCSQKNLRHLRLETASNKRGTDDDPVRPRNCSGEAFWLEFLAVRPVDKERRTRVDSRNEHADKVQRRVLRSPCSAFLRSPLATDADTRAFRCQTECL